MRKSLNTNDIIRIPLVVLKFLISLFSVLVTDKLFCFPCATHGVVVKFQEAGGQTIYENQNEFKGL